ncbi:hypothetical protein NRIC_26620 [Enterococcus florum]|uniref:Uncharacterized protein n=1 Tax=Enterococcus florum TaxID=2480627 RepID=A0A4P5PEL6_9ENTE|nr:SpaH/EbpB family LPXTG-anchored major pilin [Enterococcus florum]GCF94771.1 hypothetical protein NRIC_26620 [Enterococcus florum]
MSFKKLWKMIRVAAVAMVATSGLALGGGLDAHAATDVDVTLHKLKFETMPGNIENTGEEMDAEATWGANDPLEGVTFDVYDVTAAYHAAYAATFTGNNHAAAAAAAVAAVQGTTGTMPTTTPAAVKVDTQKTDTDGEALFSSLPGTSGGKDAVYVFVESGTPSHTVVSQKSHNLVLALPVRNSNDEENTDIHLYPKNQISETEIEITKNTTKYDHNVGERVDYWIISDIPTNIDSTYTDPDDGSEKPSYTKFKLIDKHSTQLTFDDTAAYTLTTTSGKTLTEGTHYNIVDKEDDGFVVELTQAGINYLENTDGELRFDYKMYLNDTAAMDTAYINEVKVETDFHDIESPEIPEVGTGGHRFIKEDSNTENPIEGAQFVVRDADSDTAKYLVIDSTTKEISWTTVEADATVFTSDSDGKFEVAGLENGTYWLEETVPPTGYEKIDDRIEFEVFCGGETGVSTPGTYTETTTVPTVVPNVRKGFLPSTGGKGIVAIMAVGIISIAIGAAYFGKKRITA